MKCKDQALYLTNKDVDAYFEGDVDCIEMVNESLKLKNNAFLPAKMSMIPFPGSFQTIMPVMIHDLGVSGFKFVTRYADRQPILESSISIYDSNNGNKLAELDGESITNIRTGAVAAHSIELLAIKNYSIIGIMGLGTQARATMKILLPRLTGRIVTIKLLKYKDQHLKFKEFLETLPSYNKEKIKIEYQENIVDTVQGSDVVISAISYTDADICEPEYFKKGCLLVPIHTRGFMGCDIAFDRVFGDDYDHIKGFKYFKQFKNFTETADVITEQKPGRTSNDERIIAYNIGIALHDLYFSYYLLKEHIKVY